MTQKIDFGDVGVKIGDEIVLTQRPDVEIVVGSGAGVPGNGGTLVYYKDRRTEGLFSITLMTKKLLGDEFPPDADIFSLWTYNGRTLRELYNEQSASRKLTGFTFRKIRITKYHIIKLLRKFRISKWQ